MPGVHNYHHAILASANDWPDSVAHNYIRMGISEQGTMMH